MCVVRELDFGLLVVLFILVREGLRFSLFPYTTLFRSQESGGRSAGAVLRGLVGAVYHNPMRRRRSRNRGSARSGAYSRSEEHTSELQSRGHLVCRLLLEKKKDKENTSMQDHRTCIACH